MIELVVGAVVAVLLLFALITAAMVRVSRERVRRAWGDVAAAVDARAAVAERMAASVRAYAGEGPEVKDLAARAAVVAAAPVEARERAELAMVGTWQRILTLVAEYPELQGDPAFRHLYGSLKESQARTEQTVATYDLRARRLNRRMKSRVMRVAVTMLRTAPAPDFDPGDPLARR
jgi:hypothetical protein